MDAFEEVEVEDRRTVKKNNGAYREKEEAAEWSEDGPQHGLFLQSN